MLELDGSVGAPAVVATEKSERESRADAVSSPDSPPRYKPICVMKPSAVECDTRQVTTNVSPSATVVGAIDNSSILTVGESPTTSSSVSPDEHPVAPKAQLKLTASPPSLTMAEHASPSLDPPQYGGRENGSGVP